LDGKIVTRNARKGWIVQLMLLLRNRNIKHSHVGKNQGTHFPPTNRVFYFFCQRTVDVIKKFLRRI